MTPGEPVVGAAAEAAHDEEQTPDDGDGPIAVVMSPRRLILSSMMLLAGLMASVAAVGLWFREPLLRVSRIFVDSLGGLGVGLGFFIPDALTVPLPNDVVALLGLAGGMSFLQVTVWATSGSILGGCVGYWIGRYLRSTKTVRRILGRGGGMAQRVLDRYGITAVAVAAVTPLPYSIFCWAAGAGRLSFKSFFLVSQLRVIRVAGYLYLIQLGLFSVVDMAS
jgi:membrane protein YqaA with SNARE-associated domain